MRGRRSVAMAALWLLLAAVGAAEARAEGFTVTWDGSGGLYPDEGTPPWTLSDGAAAAPTLSSDLLTLTTSAAGETLAYLMTSPLVDTGVAFFVEARVRYVSGFTNHEARAPIAIGITTAPNVGNALYIGQDEIFLNSGDLTRGPAASVDTDGEFHTFRLEFDGSGALSVLYDGSLVLTGSVFANASFNGSDQRIYWGDGTVYASGVSEWEFVRHNASTVDPVPEPGTLVLLGAGLAGLRWARRRRLRGRA